LKRGSSKANEERSKPHYGEWFNPTRSEKREQVQTQSVSHGLKSFSNMVVPFGHLLPCAIRHDISSNQWHQPMPRSWPNNILASDEILRVLAAQMFPRREPTRLGQVDFINR
jgi:hypothetical protein